MAALTTTTAITTTTSRALVATLLQSLVFYLCVLMSVLFVVVWRYHKSVKRRFEIRDRCTARLWMTIEDLKMKHANRVSELSDELARLEEGLRSERDLSGYYARSVMDANQTRRDAEQQLASVSEQLIAARHDLEDARRHSEFSAQQREFFERKAADLRAHIKSCGYPAVPGTHQEDHAPGWLREVTGSAGGLSSSLVSAGSADPARAYASRRAGRKFEEAICIQSDAMASADSQGALSTARSLTCGLGGSLAETFETFAPAELPAAQSLTCGLGDELAESFDFFAPSESSASLSPSVTVADISDVAGTRPLSIAKDTTASSADDVSVAAPRTLSLAKRSSVTVISASTAVSAAPFSRTTTADSDVDSDMTLVAAEDEDPADSPIAMAIARGMLAPFRRARAGAPVMVPASHAFFEDLLAPDAPAAPSKTRARRNRAASRAGKENAVCASAPRRTAVKFV